MCKICVIYCVNMVNPLGKYGLITKISIWLLNDTVCRLKVDTKTQGKLFLDVGKEKSW